MLSAVVPLLLVGCEPGGEDSEAPPSSGCEPGPAPTLTLGKGETAYAELDEGGSTVELVHGPQGGFHVVAALEARHADASTQLVATFRGYIDGVLLAESTPYVDFRCNQAEDALQAWGFLVIWDARPEELDGKPAHLEVELEDAAGRRLSAAGDVTIEDPTLE